MGKKTKITSFDSTWNPVTGCIRNCPYCYATRIADRFSGYIHDDANRHKYSITGYKGTNIYTVDTPMTRETKSGEIQTAVYPFGFEPTLFTYKLKEPQTWEEPKNIFVCSMADLFGEWTPDEWIQKVFEACDKAPQHRYFFLTKNPDRYCDLYDRKLLPKRDNYWYGTTVTNAGQKYFSAFRCNSFLSIEPIQEYLSVGLGSFGGVDWLIIGAETGNRIGKVKPKREWIDNILEAASITQIPVFMKDSLQKLMGDDFRQEFPWQN